MKKSIRTRLIGNFMFIIIITVAILEVLIISIFKQNYYKNLESNLSNQIHLSSDIYAKYFSDTSLSDNILNNVDTFWKQTSSEVQIFDSSGKALMDSTGFMPSDKVNLPDVKSALAGKEGKWIGIISNDVQEVMAVSYPLKNSSGRIVGAIRLISSLKNVNKAINNLVFIFITIGLIVITIVGFLAFILSNTIVKPLNKVTSVAAKMADGNYNIKSKKEIDDEIGKLSDTLNYMAAEILKKDQLKNDFISSVSHELRTPLTSIKGWAITLRETNFEDHEMYLNGLEIIENESDRLTGMVEELLDFSKFVSGKVTLKLEEVDVKRTMEYIKKQLTPRAQREKVLFSVMYDDNIPTIMSDGNRLKQLFINLIDNSFNFTPTGGNIKFIAKYLGESIVFYVIDTGCGISQEELPRVKEKFYKGKTSKSKNGIGLSICDEIVTLMNGSFDIKSDIDKGTEVIITLPLQEVKSC